MIWKIWTFLLFVIVGGVWLLAIPLSPAPILNTGTVIPIYRAMGMVPEPGGTTVSDALGHDVFEVPAEDAERLKAMTPDMAMEGMNMDGMNMDGMNMAGEAMDGSAMQMGEAAKGTAMEGMNMDGMNMAGEAEHAEEKSEAAHAEEEEDEAGHGGGSAAEGLIILAQGTAAEVDAAIAAKRLKIDAKARVDMMEWGFESGMLMSEPGRRVRLTVRNTGSLPHEFMIMNAMAMNAVNYRLARSDWNLLEHEALTEVPFIMPGDSVDMVVEITKSGSWMYMCMFPYHMQMGMMGMLMTPDRMGQMGSMNMNM